MAKDFIKRLLVGASAAVLVACAGSPRIAAPTVTPQEAQTVRVDTSSPLQPFNRTALENAQLFKRVTTRLMKASGEVCGAQKVDCTKIEAFYKEDPAFNAFATDRQIFVLSGLVKYMSEPELASVIAHEMGHVALRHQRSGQAQSIAGAVIAGGLTAIAGGGPQAVQQAAQVGAGLTRVTFSKDKERDADAFSADLMTAAGYNVRDASGAWVKMIRLQTAAARGQIPPASSGFLSTHPTGAERVVAWDKLAEEIERQGRLPAATTAPAAAPPATGTTNSRPAPAPR